MAFLPLQRGCAIFQGSHQGASEEEWRTVAAIFRLSCKVLTTPTPAEGQSSSTCSLISGVRSPPSAYQPYWCAMNSSRNFDKMVFMQVATLLESAWEGTWSEDITAVLNVGL